MSPSLSGGSGGGVSGSWPAGTTFSSLPIPISAPLLIDAYVPLAVDDTYVYFTGFSDGKLYRALARDGSGVEQLGDISPSNVLAVNSTHVYWQDQATSHIFRAVKADGGSPAEVVDVITSSFALDDDHIFYGLNDGVSLALWRANADGSGAAQLVDTSVGWVAVDTAAVYWANGDDSLNIWAAAKDGTNPVLLIAAPYSTSLAVDAFRVYWQDFHTGIAWRAPKDGSGTSSLMLSAAATGGSANSLAVDTDALYFSDANGLVWRALTGETVVATVPLA